MAENIYMDTLMGEIPILKEPEPQQVSIYHENSEADDWFNQQLALSVDNVQGYIKLASFEPGFFLIKSLAFTFYNARGAPFTWNLRVYIDGGDYLLNLGNYSAAIGTTISYDFTSIFKDVKISQGVKIVVYVEQLMPDAGTNTSTATLTMTGFKIRPFDVYKPSDTLK
jgi:hypothetical protein